VVIIKRNIVSHLLILLIILFVIPISYAGDETFEKISAKNIKVTSEYVEADGVCSCSLMEDRSHHHSIFENYCPACGSKGTLKFEQGSISYTCPEGMWYCTNCDADYCLVHGKEHREGTHWYLKPYHKPAKTQTNKKSEIEQSWIKYNKSRLIV
jgi:hypothetical protein